MSAGGTRGSGEDGYVLRSMMAFRWNGQELAYFDHPYNHTALNSRRVEVPIARWFLARAGKGARILEVGNVLAHYGPVAWPVVDLREPHCINEDIMRWKPAKPFNLVISISTIEHVNAPASVVLARLRGWLGLGGILMATAPTGYKPALDEDLRQGKLRADQSWYLRALPSRRWEECTMQEALDMPRRACAGRWCGGVMILLCRGVADA